METFLGILRLVLIGLLPPLAAVGFYFLERKTKYGGLKPILKQIIGGVVFGGLAIIATEFGANVNGAVLNVRDAAAVTAGLLYGLPGGVIAGFIGGVERFASAYWNNTFYTQWACSISTFLSGLTAGVLRRFVFSNKRPSWAHALLVGLVTETFHMLMIFLTNATDPITAFTYVRLLGNKMITANMLSATAAMGILNILDYALRDKTLDAPKKTKKPKKTKERQMRATIAVALSIIGLAAIGISGILTFGLQSGMAYRNADNLLNTNVRDAKSDVDDTSNNNILGLAHNVANKIEETGYVPGNEFLYDILPASGVSEIHYINTQGIITATTVEASYNYDMSLGEQSAEFLVLLDNPGEYVQPFMPTSQDAKVKKKYAAVSLSFGGFVQVGWDAGKFYFSNEEIVTQVVQNRHIGESGYMLVCDDEFIIYSRHADIDGKPLSSLGFATPFDLSQAMKIQTGNIRGAHSYYMFDRTEGFYVIAVVDTDTMLLSRDMATFLGIYMEILVFSILFICVYALIDRLVLRDLVKANDQLAKIAGGDLEQKLSQHHSAEMAQLNDSINTTVDSLKNYIALEASRYDEELALGKQIQTNSLPSKGAYLFRHDFAIFGSMVTAKQVGGDFYDYFLLADKRIAFLIADVSGKGIPAALFMMKTKSIIKAMAENGLPISEVMLRANERVCEGNETGTFVTAWLGICDVTTGLVEYVNAGHNPPMALIKGKYQKLEMKRDLVLGAMEGVTYRRQTMQLEPGDVLFLYTDGITEAEAGPEEFYGEKRLLDFLNKNSEVRDPFTICNIVTKDVHAFTQGHDQSDDMTMVCFTYLGTPKQYHFDFASTAAGVSDVCEKVADALKDCGIHAALVDKVRLVVEEVAANIAFHAYELTTGMGELDLAVNATQIAMTFADKGPRFNPLEMEDPDITMDAKTRPVGGLGIFLVKKLCDKKIYTYQEGKNVLLLVVNR